MADGALSYKEKDSKREYKISEDLYICIKTMSIEVAMLFFVDQKGSEVPIKVPPGYRVELLRDDNKKAAGVPPTPGNNLFLIFWHSSYHVMRDGSNILTLLNQPRQALYPCAELKSEG